VVAFVLRLGVRLFLGPSELARNLPLAVPSRCALGRLPGLFFHLSGRGSKAPLVGGVQPGPISRYRFRGTIYIYKYGGIVK